MKSISVFLVDDNPTFLRAATRFLQKHEEIVVVGQAGVGDGALAEAQALQPQVILIALGMPGLPCLEIIARLRETLPDVGIIALTLLDTKGYEEAVLAAGADALLPKVTLSTDLLPAMRRVMRARPPEKPREKSALDQNDR